MKAYKLHVIFQVFEKVVKRFGVDFDCCIEKRFVKFCFFLKLAMLRDLYLKSLLFQGTLRVSHLICFGICCIYQKVVHYEENWEIVGMFSKKNVGRLPEK